MFDFRYVIYFGATGQEGYVCIGYQNLPRVGKPRIVNVDIFSLKMADIGKFWSTVQEYQTQNPFCFLNSDGPFLWHILTKLSLDPLLCAVHLVGWSLNRVYAISCPVLRNSCISSVLTPQKYDFLVKIVEDKESYQIESEILDTLKPNYYRKSIGFEQFPTLDISLFRQNPKLTKFLEEHKKNVKLVARDSWWNKTPVMPVGGGGIIMSRGISVTRSSLNDESLQTVYLDLCKCLSNIHKLGYLHRDIRWPNVIFNPKTKMYELIDFGNACSISNSDIRISEDSRFVPSSIPKPIDDSIIFKWTTATDFEMLGHMIIIHKLVSFDQ